MSCYTRGREGVLEGRREMGMEFRRESEREGGSTAIGIHEVLHNLQATLLEDRKH